MAKTKITTMMDDAILKKVKIRAIEEDMNIGEILEKAFKFYSEKSNIKNFTISNMNQNQRTIYLSGVKTLMTALEHEIEMITQADIEDRLDVNTD